MDHKKQKKLGQWLGFTDAEIDSFLIAATHRRQHWSALFPRGDTVILPLTSKDDTVLSLSDRMDAVLGAYHKTEEGKNRPVTIITNNPKQLQRGNKVISATNFLRSIDEAEAWLLAHDLEMEWDKVARQQTNPSPPVEAIQQKPISFQEIQNRETQPVDHIAPQSFRVVISRDPIDIAGMSTGRRWHSCMEKGAMNYGYVPQEIEAGTLVAYLVHKEDKEYRYPLIRVLLKPFSNDKGQTILVPNRIYPRDVAGNSIATDAFLNTVHIFIAPHNDKAQGRFTMDKRVYPDAQETMLNLGDKATALDGKQLASGIADGIRGKRKEYFTEIQAGEKVRDLERVAQFTQRLKRLYAAPQDGAILYLRNLRDGGYAQQKLPKPSEVISAMKSAEVQRTLEVMRLEEKHTDALIVALSSVPVREVHIGNTNRYRNTVISDANLAVLARNTTIEYLSLRQCYIDNKGMIALAKSTAIKHLDLAYCKIDDGGLAVLAENKIITHLDLWCLNDISSADVTALAKSTTLKTLNLGFNTYGRDYFGREIMDEGVEVLAQSTSIEHLDLRERDKIMDRGVKALARNTVLKSLDLSDCKQITDVGALALASNTNITKLSLRCCYRITDKGVEALAKNTNITRLGLSSNYSPCHITDKSVASLAENTTLTDLSIPYQNITVGGMMQLISGLLKNKNILDAPFKNDNKALATHLKRNAREATRYAEKLAEPDDTHVIGGSERQRILARANAILKMAEKMEPQQQARIITRITEIRQAITSTGTTKKLGSLRSVGNSQAL